MPDLLLSATLPALLNSTKLAYSFFNSKKKQQKILLLQSIKDRFSFVQQSYLLAIHCQANNKTTTQFIHESYALSEYPAYYQISEIDKEVHTKLEAVLTNKNLDTQLLDDMCNLYTNANIKIQIREKLKKLNPDEKYILVNFLIRQVTLEARQQIRNNQSQNYYFLMEELLLKARQLISFLN